MSHPSNGQLSEQEIPGIEQSVKALKKMTRIRRAELIPAVGSGEDYLWVMDEEPSNRVPENYDEWRRKHSSASVFKERKMPGSSSGCTTRIKDPAISNSGGR